MRNKKISINSFLLIIILAAFIIIIILAATYIFLYLNPNSKENVKKEDVPKIKHCSRDEYSPKEEIRNWKTYFNDERCFSIQYPEKWQVLESMENIGPYVAFGKEKIDDPEIYPKIFINVENMQFFAGFLAQQTFLYNAETISLWQGSEPALRIKGNIEDSEKAKEAVTYTYSDSIIIPREEKDFYIVLSYNEKEFDEEAREIFERMYESFNIAENQSNL